MAPLFLGVDISSVSDMTLLGSYTQTTLFIFFMRKMPDMFPEQWEKVHLPYAQTRLQRGHVDLASSPLCPTSGGRITNSDAKTIFFNVLAIMVVGVVFSLVW